MEDFYKIWLQHNPQTRLSADEEKVLGEKIQSGKALAAKKKNCCLFLVRFHKPPVMKHKHFSVMLTYILAEFMIVYGLSL